MEWNNIQMLYSIHGGIPRPIAQQQTEVQAILAMPTIVSIMPG